jgi:ubiquinone/menaquinone biosynthesis C-methylase UbiE/uncharacterized protein YbaR (Trm112 family)
MNKNKIAALKSLYQSNTNIMAHIKQTDQKTENDLESILISYDLQAGSYIQLSNGPIKQSKQLYNQEIIDVLSALTFDSILEVGVGEGTTLSPILDGLSRQVKSAGFDISWSRIRYAKQYLAEQKHSDAFVFTADLFNIPLADNSFDVVYTSHSIEPNGGKEQAALESLYRITGKYLVLFEPSYELSNDAIKNIIKGKAYITCLHETAINLGYKVIEHRLLQHPVNPNNPTSVIVIEKNPNYPSEMKWACPLTGGLMEQYNDSFFSPESYLAYPIVNGIPCLLPENGIVASHYGDFNSAK